MMGNRMEDCESVSEVLAILEEENVFDSSWQAFFSELLDSSGLSYARFAGRCGLSKNTVKRWRLQGGSPRSRDTYLKVGFGAAMAPEAVSKMLSKYGGYTGLNPRDPFDACCDFCLRRRCKGDLRYDYAAAEALYRKLSPELEERAAGSDLTTTRLSAHLASIDTEAGFKEFFKEYGSSLSGRKHKLERFIDDFLTVRRLEAKRGGGGSLHSLALPPAAEKDISMLKVHGIVPRRKRLIALGLHLGMTLEELEILLKYAGMDALRIRDKMEAVLIYALQQLALTHPELALGNATALLAVTRDSITRNRCAELARDYWQMGYKSEADDVESVARYVRGVLEQLDAEDADGLISLL